jgi:hypothetical protein
MLNITFLLKKSLKNCCDFVCWIGKKLYLCIAKVNNMSLPPPHSFSNALITNRLQSGGRGMCEKGIECGLAVFQQENASFIFWGLFPHSENAGNLVQTRTESCAKRNKKRDI